MLPKQVLRIDISPQQGDSSGLTKFRFENSMFTPRQKDDVKHPKSREDCTEYKPEGDVFDH